MKKTKSSRQVKAQAVVRTLKQTLAHAEGLLLKIREHDNQIADGASNVPNLQAKIKALETDNRQLRLSVNALEAQLNLQSSTLDSAYYKELGATGDALDALPVESILPVQTLLVGKMAGAATRLRNALRNLGITTIGELKRSDLYRFQETYRMTKRALEMLSACMKHHKIEFTPPPSCSSSGGIREDW